MKHVMLLLLLLCVACKKIDIDYKYKVTCGSCDITFKNSDAQTEQLTVHGSWDHSLSSDAGGFLYISAQNNFETGSVSVAINNGDDHLDSDNCSGAFCIATASRSVR